jgi:peptide/nickel transport system ATP-binding protein
MGRPARQRIEQLATRSACGASRWSAIPHEFSGGQRQRIAIARALAVSRG